MSINLSVPKNNDTPELKPRISVIGVGGAGGNAVNNMIESQLEGVEFVVANADAQALAQSRTDRRIQLGVNVTQGLGAGSRPEIGRAAAEESLDQIIEEIKGSNMAFIAAGMGGGTGTGAAPVIARAARELGILTVGVVTKPFDFEGVHRMRAAVAGIEDLEQFVDTLIIIPNQNLFRIANEKTTFADAFAMADEVLHSGVRGVTDLMVMPGLINLDFADIRTVMSEMGKAMMGTGEAEGERRALDAAEAAIANPLLDDSSMKGAKGVLINIVGGADLTLFEVDEAANRIREEVDEEAYINFGSIFDPEMEGKIRVSVVATGINSEAGVKPAPAILSLAGRNPVQTLMTEVPANETPLPAPVVTVARSDAPPAADDTIESEPDTDKKEVAAEGSTASDDAPSGMDAGTPPPATPSTDATDAFIPPAPVERLFGSRGAKSADPFAAAAMANGGPRTEPDAPISSVKEKGPSLFERVTGTGRAAKPASPEPVTESAPLPSKPQDPSSLGGLDGTGQTAAPTAEEDLLDIPAFLRRQAN